MKQFEIAELEKISALNFANIFNVNDEPKLGVNYKTYNINRTLNFLDLDESSTDNNALFESYRVNSGDTWTIISFKFYQTIELWWLVCKINNVIDPTTDPIVSKKIKVLKSSVVNEILTSIREG